MLCISKYISISAGIGILHNACSRTKPGYSELTEFNPVAEEYQQKAKQGSFHIHATNIGMKPRRWNTAYGTRASLPFPSSE